jgi:hypothetical protein
MINSIITPLIVLFLAIIVFVVFNRLFGFNENWQDYKMLPFGEVKSGSAPLYFYSYNRYRKPYRWPFKHHSSYPYPHLEPGR